jgi:hypothetical protein
VNRYLNFSIQQRILDLFRERAFTFNVTLPRFMQAVALRLYCDDFTAKAGGAFSQALDNFVRLR